MTTKEQSLIDGIALAQQAGYSPQDVIQLRQQLYRLRRNRQLAQSRVLVRRSKMAALFSPDSAPWAIFVKGKLVEGGFSDKAAAVDAAQSY